MPDWCADQRNQMTGPADDAELTVKLLNSGSPAVMIDLEDSMANAWDQTMLGVKNTLAAYKYELSYDDKKRKKKVTVQRSKTVTWVRPRGLHVSQGGVIPNEIMSASLFDLALIWYQINPASLPHNFSVYIPKSESAEEAFWWRDLFQVFAKQKGLPKDYIKCMAISFWSGCPVQAPSIRQSASFFLSCFRTFRARSFNSGSVRLGKSAVMPPMAKAPCLWQISGINVRKFWKKATSCGMVLRSGRIQFGSSIMKSISEAM